MRIMLTALLALLLTASAALAQDDNRDESPAGWSPEPGQVIHIEIPSLNLEESAEFYGSLFGWETMPSAGSEQYLIWSDGGQTMGGFTTDGVPAPEGGVILYIFTLSIADAYVAIEAAGGRPSGVETSVGDGEGYIGMFNDPHGNLIGLYSMQQSLPVAGAADGEAADSPQPAGESR